jgi:hypothetical protein
MFVVIDENLNKLQWDQLCLVTIKTNKFDDHVLGWLEKLDLKKTNLCMSTFIALHCTHVFIFGFFLILF